MTLRTMLRSSVFGLVASTLAACGGSTASTPSSTPADQPPAAGCIKGGCSGTLCVAADAEQMVTTCEWLDAYACYADAACEAQADGACGFTPTEELTACLANPPATEGGGADMPQ